MVDAGGALGGFDKQVRWTNQQVQRVRDLAADNLSVGQIAKRMGLSRNSVCGVVARNNITLARSRSSRLAAKREKVKAAQSSPQPAAVPEPFVLREAAGVDPRLVPLEGLKGGECRWPYGDGPFHFCGCAAGLGRPYCIPHTELATR